MRVLKMLVAQDGAQFYELISNYKGNRQEFQTVRFERSYRSRRAYVNSSISERCINFIRSVGNRPKRTIGEMLLRDGSILHPYVK